jgi:hypothetical protein
MNAQTSTWRDPRLRWAIALAFIVHGGLLTAGSYRGTYDAWVHIFFGDHYARDWFSTWEPRWYTGFTTVSYPPASHQSIALGSKLVGLTTAFVVVQLAAVITVVVGVYRFSLLWVSREAAGWAALLAVVSSSLAEVVHTFGQLPTTFALGFLLNAQPSIRRWIHDGVRSDLLAARALLAATTAGHHVTTLFGSVFFTGPVAVRAILDRWGTPVVDEPGGHAVSARPSLLLPQVARRLRRVLPATARTAVLGVLSIATLVIVVLPYWRWSSSDPITQVPIPHASRNNFLTDTAAGLVFWVVPWAGLLLLVPFAAAKAIAGRGWPLASSVGLLALLGTGGTTPIPRMLLGGAFDILTLDRFTIWATIAILPFAGWAIMSLRGGLLSDIGVAWFGKIPTQVFATLVVATAIAASVFAATLTTHRPFQPRAIDPAPISSFMDKDQHDRWRYLTLGFGDQMAWVAANTTALTVDGNYHSARRLPELTSRSVERLEGAKYRGIPGIGSLQQFLINPSPYHLKFVFSIDRFYDPLLWSSGWQRIGTLDNDVEVWERADVPPLPDVLPEREIPGWQRALWGVLPMSSVAAGIITLFWLGAGRRLPRRLRFVGMPQPVPGRLLAWVDGHLERVSDRLRDAPGLRPQRQPWSSAHRRVVEVLGAARHPRSTRARWAATTLILLGVATIAAAVGRRETAAPGPAETIESYYDALDFRRFDHAHGLLDPSSRPDLATYLLQISVRDGLLDGYSELDSVRSDVEISGDRATADIDLVYVTSVAEYLVERRHDLVRRDGAWFIEPIVEPIQRPVDQLVVRPETSVSSLGRSQVTAGTTSFDDILDRPRLALGPASTYRVGERWIIVGTVTNVDVDPADVTVNGTLRGADDDVLASYDAGQATIHQVLPGETVPYRIDFEGRAGSVDRDDPVAAQFDPLAYAEPVLDGEVASVDVAARAVVTGGQLERVVDVVAATATSAGDAISLEVRLRNAGTTSATVTRLTVSYLDQSGDVVWVDHHWVPESVRPQRTLDVEWSAAAPDADASDLPLRSFDDAQLETGDAVGTRGGLVVPISGDPVAAGDRLVTAVRLDVSSFQRSVEP